MKSYFVGFGATGRVCRAGIRDLRADSGFGLQRLWGFKG